MRGGTLKISDLTKAIETCEVVRGRPGISVDAALVTNGAALLSQSRIHHRLVSFSTAQRIYDAGFDLEQTGTWPHHTLWLPAGWRTGDVLQRLKDAFDAPVDRSDV
jgi:hypothetical protein